jgi:hypothetical protein
VEPAKGPIKKASELLLILVCCAVLFVFAIRFHVFETIYLIVAPTALHRNGYLDEYLAIMLLPGRNKQGSTEVRRLSLLVLSQVPR